jgi:polyisoprenoid-binding protein YceI
MVAMKTWVKWTIAGGVLAVVGVVVGFLIWVNFIKADAPERFTLEAATTTTVIATTTTTTTEPADEADAATTTTASTTTVPATAATDGSWVVGDGSAVGYRVVEVLFGVDTEGVGRTDQVTGQLTLAGSQVTDGSFEADLRTVVSDENRRDNQFRGRLMDTENFPTGTFTLTAPIELGSVPADATPVTATATGELTLRGVTNPVTVDIQAQKNGDTIQVVGSTDVVFADYGIPQPEAPGITTQDHGLLEFDLRLARA